MTATLLLPVVAASLLGSLHCAGMCGGLVCFYSGSTRGATPASDGRSPELRGHAAYHLGRLASYLLLGTLAGLLGVGLDQVGALGGIGRLAAVVAGAIMIGWGIAQLVTVRRTRSGGLADAAVRIMAPLLSRLAGRTPTIRAASLGLLTTLIPCGWLYGYVAVAAGTGSIAGGLAVMAAFWLGTVPALLAVGGLATRLSGAARVRVPTVTALVLIVLGLVTLTGRLRPFAAADHARPHAATLTADAHGTP